MRDPVCTAEQIRAAYTVGLRIVWDTNGRRDTWDVEEADATGATTRFTAADGAITMARATFDELSSHSSFPQEAGLSRVTFDTPFGVLRGTRAVVAEPDGPRRFWFADEFPGPPMIVEGPGFVQRQVERSDAPTR